MLHLSLEEKSVGVYSGAADPLPSFYLGAGEGKGLVFLTQTSCASMRTIIVV